jgi:DNA-binding transcriptional ArsR family regulator
MIDAERGHRDSWGLEVKDPHEENEKKTESDDIEQIAENLRHSEQSLGQKIDRLWWDNINDKPTRTLSGKEKLLEDYKKAVLSALDNDENLTIYKYLRDTEGKVGIKELDSELELEEVEIAEHLQELEEASLVDRDYHMDGNKIIAEFEAAKLREEGEDLVEDLV